MAMVGLGCVSMAQIPASFPSLLQGLPCDHLSCERYTCCRLVPAFVALTTGAAAYYLGKTSSDDRMADKKNKRVTDCRRSDGRVAESLRGYGQNHCMSCFPFAVQAFLLLIQHEYKSIRDRDAFIELFKPLAKYVKQHEPETLAYELSVSDKDPHKLLVFERCGPSPLIHPTLPATCVQRPGPS